MFFGFTRVLFIRSWQILYFFLSLLILSFSFFTVSPVVLMHDGAIMWLSSPMKILKNLDLFKAFMTLLKSAHAKRIEFTKLLQNNLALQ